MAEATTPPPDTSAITANEVATMVCIGRSVARRNAGTMTKPPPTPSNPDRKPAPTPDAANARAHGSVQTSLAVVLSRWQGGAVRLGRDAEVRRGKSSSREDPDSQTTEKYVAMMKIYSI